MLYLSAAAAFNEQYGNMAILLSFLLCRASVFVMACVIFVYSHLVAF